MSETIITFCDFCNLEQSRNSDGSGYTECPEEVAISEFDWKRVGKKIMCRECQDKLEESE